LYREVVDDDRQTDLTARLRDLESLPLAERAEGYSQLLDALRTELEAAPTDSPAR